MSIIVDEYRQQAVQQLFKKDLRKIKNFLIPINIIKFKNFSNTFISLDINSTLQQHTSFFYYTYKSNNKLSYSFSFDIHTLHIHHLSFLLKPFTITENIGDNIIYIISYSNNNKNFVKTRLNLTNPKEYSLDRQLFIYIKEKKYNYHLIDSLIKETIKKYKEV